VTNGRRSDQASGASVHPFGQACFREVDEEQLDAGLINMWEQYHLSLGARPERRALQVVCERYPEAGRWRLDRPSPLLPGAPHELN
jgi:hypothetical protein